MWKLSKISSSFKEKLEYFLSTNDFEHILYISTSNSYQDVVSTQELYLLADCSYN